MKKYTIEELIEKFKSVKLLCVDADGTLTDGVMSVNSAGVDTKNFFAHDGTGLSMVRQIGVKVAVVTTSLSGVISERAKALNLDFFVPGSMDKGKDILDICNKININPKDAIHMGDDVNDILGFNVVGFPIGVSNSASAILEFVCYVTKNAGGFGGVREICDLLMLAKTGKLYGEPYVSKLFTQ